MLWRQSPHRLLHYPAHRQTTNPSTSSWCLCADCLSLRLTVILASTETICDYPNHKAKSILLKPYSSGLKGCRRRTISPGFISKSSTLVSIRPKCIMIVIKPHFWARNALDKEPLSLVRIANIIKYFWFCYTNMSKFDDLKAELLSLQAELAKSRVKAEY